MASEQAMALYRKLNSSGTAITSNNWREWERLASSAMKMADFTPAGQSESLHDLANEVGIEIQALKSRASRPGAKDMMAATPHKITLKDKSGVTQTWMVSDKILRDMNATKRHAEATGAKPDYSSVLRLGVRMGEVVLASRPGAKARFKVEDRFYFGKGRKERFGAADKVDSLIATAYRALRDGDKAAARRLIARAEELIQSDSSVPDYIVNELKDLKKSLRF